MNGSRRGHKHTSASQPSNPARSANSNVGCWVIGAIVALVFAMSQCSSSTKNGASSSATDSAATSPEAVATAIATQSPPPVAALDKASVHKGAHDVGIAAKEGLAGEMIYSQNCYDALGHGFSWKKLDQCGAFDISASEALGDQDDPGATKEVEWFQSETAAGRYLKAAIAAGQDPDAADSRLDALKSSITASLPKSTKPKATASTAEISHKVTLDPNGLEQQKSP